jgi:hypothetical protein
VYAQEVRASGLSNLEKQRIIAQKLIG